MLQVVAAAPDGPGGAGPQHGEPAAVAAHAHPHARDRSRDAAAAAHVGADVAANKVILKESSLRTLIITEWNSGAGFNGNANNLILILRHVQTTKK